MDSKSQPSLTVFLLGSGFSLAAEMPSTRALTDLVIPPGEFCKWSGGYYWGPSPSPEVDARGNDPARREAIRYLIERVSIQGKQHLRDSASWHQLTFEDVYYAIERLSEIHMVPVLDPWALSAEKELRNSPEIRRLLRKAEWEWGYLVVETLSCLKWLVWDKLRHRPPVPQVDFLRDSIDDIGIASINIVTTNHDLLIESCLSEWRVPLSDGFGKFHRGRIWMGDYGDGETTLRLYKPHGSVNWFRFTATSAPPLPTHFVLEDAPDPFIHPKFGTLMSQGDPLILMGTENKREMYTSHPYAEIYCRSRTAILRATNIIACGYGFGDRGVNQMLFDWAFHQRTASRRLLIAEPDYGEFLGRINPGIRRHFNELEQHGVLRPVTGVAAGMENSAKGIKQLQWNDLCPHLIRA